MQTYLLKRLLLTIPMLFGITFISFLVMQLAPGESGGGTGGDGNRSQKITANQREVMNRTFHLDERIDRRYLFWLGILQNTPTKSDLSKAQRRAVSIKLYGKSEINREPTSDELANTQVSPDEIHAQIPKTGLLFGDFGHSMQIHSKTVWELLADAIPVTLLFNTLTLFFIYLFAIPLGVYSATHQGTKADKFATIVLFMLYSMPNFWFGLLVIKFVVWLPPNFRLPIQGIHPPNSNQLTFLEWFSACSRYFVLPLIVMSYSSFSGMSRYMRSGMIDTIRSDYVRTARAKGLREFIVVYKHALRNSLIPIITLLGSELPALFSGSVIVETLFGIPGMGKLAFEALLARDYTVLMADLTLVAVMVMFGFMVSDILYKVADPRISFEGE
ncbi:MAG: ABC transporter permease [Planctomycetota bacterium]